VLAALGKLTDAVPAERLLLSDVLPLAEQIAEDLRAHPASDAVEVAGSARRRTETCHDIDLIATASEPAALGKALLEHPLAAAKGSSGEGGARITIHNGIAVIESGTVERHETEAEVYKRLELAYIEPELREGRGEIAAAAERKLPDLVAAADIRGDLHCHTTLSDGRNTLEEMAEAAQKRGYAYLALTDHSASHGFGNDVPADALLRRVDEVAAYNEANTGTFRLLAGSEVNVLPDGSLDYDEEVLSRLDWVIASVHTSFRISAKKMTDRVIAAIENPHVDCIGHLTGRLINRREPYDINVGDVVEAAAANKTFLEINGNPNRRDLSETHARLAADAGVQIVINTDARGTDTLSNMRYGLATARRGWLTKADVANTRTWKQLLKLRGRSG
jgi:DNA polymerase (family 10)